MLSKPADGWHPDQRLSLHDAVRLFTREAAYAEFAEDRRGTLEVGMDADLTIFRNRLQPDRSLLANKPHLTIVGGRVVFESDEARSQRRSDALCD